MIASNNRFLQRVNPEITRALNETGAAALMRQMVDLDIAKNLVGWWHRDNVNTRFASPDTFVTSALDSSGGANNATQTTEANQPKLVSDGMEFPNDNSSLNTNYTPNFNLDTSFSFLVWVFVKSITEKWGMIVGIGNSYYTCGIFYTMADPLIGVSIQAGIRTDTSHIIRSTNIILSELNTWVHLVVTYNSSLKQAILYKTGESVSTVTNETATGTVPSGYNIGIMKPNVISGVPDYGYLDGKTNDIRIYNSALSATEIAAIYNQTKGAYGL